MSSVLSLGTTRDSEQSLEQRMHQLGTQWAQGPDMDAAQAEQYEEFLQSEQQRRAQAAVPGTGKGSGKGGGTSEDRAYVMLSKIGNQEKFTRDSIISSLRVEAELESIECTRGLPNVQQGSPEGPFHCVVNQQLADLLIDTGEHDLYSENEVCVTFDVVRTDKYGNRAYDTPRASGQPRQRDDRHRTIQMYYDIPLHMLGGDMGVAEKDRTETDRLLAGFEEKIQFRLQSVGGGKLQKVTVRQPEDAHTANTFITYSTFREGTTEQEMGGMEWHRARYITLAIGEEPARGNMANAAKRRLGLAPCCLRQKADCPKTVGGRCTARDDAWAAAVFKHGSSFTHYHTVPRESRPSARDRKRDREKAAAEAAEQDMRAARARRIAMLCDDFGKGKVRQCELTLW